MKRFKSSFLPIICILSIGLTAATKADVIEIKKLTPVENCYSSLVYYHTCNDLRLINQFISCDEAKDQVSKGVASLGTFNESIDCSGSTVFCCACLEPDPDPCPNQLQINYIDCFGVSQFGHARIAAVYCKEEQ